MEKFLNKLKNEESLNFEESKSAFESIMSGKVKEEDIYDFKDFQVISILKLSNENLEIQ